MLAWGRKSRERTFSRSAHSRLRASCIAVRLAFSSSSSVRSSMTPVYSGSAGGEGRDVSGPSLALAAADGGRGLGVAQELEVPGVEMPPDIERLALALFERVRLGGAGRAIIGDSAGGETPPMLTLTPAVEVVGEFAAMSFVGVWLRIC